jgi:hypothetical protein
MMLSYFVKCQGCPTLQVCSRCRTRLSINHPVCRVCSKYTCITCDWYDLCEKKSKRKPRPHIFLCGSCRYRYPLCIMCKKVKLHTNKCRHTHGFFPIETSAIASTSSPSSLDDSSRENCVAWFCQGCLLLFALENGGTTSTLCFYCPECTRELDCILIKFLGEDLVVNILKPFLQ